MSLPPPLMPIQPAGITPASNWEPFYVAAQRQPVVLVPKLDPTNGEQLSLVEGDDPTFQAIATEFRTIRRTGLAVQTTGHRLIDIRKNDASAPIQIRHECDRILKPYLDKRLIRVDELTITAGPEAKNKASIVLTFTVLRTQKQFTLGVKVAR